MILADLKTGEKAVIVRVNGHGSFRKRLIEMGFINGKEVRVVLNAPLKDPIEYEIIGYKVSLRREEARQIEVVSVDEAREALVTDEHLQALPGDMAEKERLDKALAHLAEERHHNIRVALVGNPNCGKTSLFNYASGSHEHVGNYSGVTVDAKEGHLHYKDYDITLVDLSQPVVQAPKNIAEIIAAIPETATGSSSAAEFDVDLENPVVVSYMIKDGSNKWNIYLEDETAGILLYLPENPGIQPGVTLKGKFTVKAYRYKGLPEIVSLAYTENPTWGQAAVPCTEVTISELLANYDKYMLRKCKIVGVTVTDGIADGDRNGEIAQGDAKIAVYAQLNNQGLVLTKDAKGDLVCIPGIFNTTKQVYFWQNDWFIPGQADEGGSNVPDYDPITGFEW